MALKALSPPTAGTTHTTSGNTTFTTGAAGQTTNHGEGNDWITDPTLTHPGDGIGDQDGHPEQRPEDLPRAA